MKKKIILFLAIALLSCEKDNILVDDSYGTTLHTIEHYSEGKWKSTETYWYSNQGELIEVTQAYPSYVDKHQISYLDGKWSKIGSYRQQRQRALYDAEYNTNGTLEIVNMFTIDNTTGQELLFSTKQYDYDSQNRVSKTTTVYADTERCGVSVFLWNGKNIQAEKKFNGKCEDIEKYLTLEAEYLQYDTNKNYKAQTLEAYLQPETLSKNNLIESILSSPTINIFCGTNPCKTQYRYNKLGYPTEIISNNATLKLSYK